MDARLALPSLTPSFFFVVGRSEPIISINWVKQTKCHGVPSAVCATSSRMHMAEGFVTHNETA